MLVGVPALLIAIRLISRRKKNAGEMLFMLRTEENLLNELANF